MQPFYDKHFGVLQKKLYFLCQAYLTQKAAETLYEKKLQELNQQAAELARAETECQRAVKAAHKDHNCTLVCMTLGV